MGYNTLDVVCPRVLPYTLVRRYLQAGPYALQWPLPVRPRELGRKSVPPGELTAGGRRQWQARGGGVL